MHNKKITILTGTGDILGTGHIQRMINLAAHLNLNKTYTASINLRQNEYPLQKQLGELFVTSIPPETDLIIRDMRDSSMEEILSLKQSAPVLTIDDSGAGREFADFTITLLPIPSGELKNVIPDTSLFLYGYNFTEGIKLLKELNNFKRDIDIAIYAGYNPSAELIASIKKSIPDTACSVLLTGGKSINFTGKILKTKNVPYAEIITRSKIVITHFGLTMFEAHACGCSIAALNPTSYHSSLTGIISTDFNIFYSDEYNIFSPENLKIKLQDQLINSVANEISVSEILRKINRGTENFINYIEKIST